MNKKEAEEELKILAIVFKRITSLHPDPERLKLGYQVCDYIDNRGFSQMMVTELLDEEISQPTVSRIYEQTYRDLSSLFNLILFARKVIKNKTLTFDEVCAVMEMDPNSVEYYLNHKINLEKLKEIKLKERY